MPAVVNTRALNPRNPSGPSSIPSSLPFASIPLEVRCQQPPPFCVGCDRKFARADLVANVPRVISEDARTLLNAKVEGARRKLAGDVGSNTLPNKITDVHRNTFLRQC